jgi:DNA-binding transcriptional regulator GbsR (MarR family)
MQNAVRVVKLGKAQRGFVEGFGHLYARYGVSITFGRLFGLLLVSDGPLSLDEIADDLGISKSGASVAARELERAGVIRRHGTPGSRRIAYEAVDDMEPVFNATFTRVRDSLSLLRREEPSLAEGRGKKRVRQMRALHEFWLHESEGVLERWRKRRDR